MDGCLHSVRICIADHFVKNLLGKYRDPAGGRIIRIRAAQIRSSGSQCSVSQHLKRPDLKKLCTAARNISRLYKSLKL